MQAASLRFSPALWRRGRGANLKPRLSQAASLATERPPRNMRLSLHPSLPREVNIQATEVTETLPQALKRDPRIDGSYARLKACSTHHLYTRCETAIATSECKTTAVRPTFPCTLAQLSDTYASARSLVAVAAMLAVGASWRGQTRQLPTYDERLPGLCSS